MPIISSITKTRTIALSQGKFAIVDAKDYDYLMQWHWHLTAQGYAATNPGPRGNKTYILMHRLVNQTPQQKSTDHKNGDKLDNRKVNLRHCTHAENKWNKPKQSNNTSGYKGVCYCRRSNGWIMQIRRGDVKIHKRFKTKEEAALAYNNYAKSLFGKFATFNKIGII